jgi:hypothetical protein
VVGEQPPAAPRQDGGRLVTCQKREDLREARCFRTQARCGVRARRRRQRPRPRSQPQSRPADGRPTTGREISNYGIPKAKRAMLRGLPHSCSLAFIVLVPA